MPFGDMYQPCAAPRSYFECLSTSGPGPSSRCYAKVSSRERGLDPAPDSRLRRIVDLAGPWNDTGMDLVLTVRKGAGLCSVVGVGTRSLLKVS